MIEAYLSQLSQPAPLSHKGENGKVLIIGGSDLFHAASQWSFLVASRWVDMTFYSSVSENNQLMHEAKMYARDGVVVPRSELLSYAGESDAILLGPGMRRDVSSRFSPSELLTILPKQLKKDDWENDTKAITAALLHAFPEKRWILDAGALQVLEKEWLPRKAVLTPHARELGRLAESNRLISSSFWEEFQRQRELLFLEVGSDQAISRPARLFSAAEVASVLTNAVRDELNALAYDLNDATLIVKGPDDIIWDKERVVVIDGGNAGLTKGGTGDALAGLVTAFCATSPSFPSLVVASYLNKMAAHELFATNGQMYNTTDLVEQLPKTWHELSNR